MKSLHAVYADGACCFHRVLQPFRFCDEYAKSQGWDLGCGDGIPAGHDVYMLHGLPTVQAIVEIGKAKRRGCKIVFSVDDDWTSIPDWNPANPGEDGMVAYDIITSMADLIICSTDHLRDTFRDVHKKVMVAPNMLDISKFENRPYAIGEDGGRDYEIDVELPIRLVWSGGPTHKNDITEMEAPLHRIMEKFGKDKVVIIYNGMSPPSSLLKKYLHNGLFHQPAVPFPSYAKVLNSIKADVYLAPLAPIEFNLSKSNLRIMEAWALMACPIASRWGEYNTIIQSVDGLLASTEDDWYDAIASIVEDHQFRLQMAISGRQRVEREYNWNRKECLTQWYQVLDRIFSLE